MKITVAVCTWNRQKLLAQTLERMKGLIIPRGVEWELLVINNNCTDGTDEVIAHYSTSLPLRRVFEPNPGLSNARNTAVREATGEYIIWTDDDVLVDEHWIEAYAAAFEGWPDAVVFGGPIFPWFDGIPPKWLEIALPRVADAYAVRAIGLNQVSIDNINLPFGANYALKLSIQKHYLYDPALGRKEKGMLGGEEISLILSVLNNGFQGRWVSDAKVAHFIPASRQNVGYLRRYYQGYGTSLAKNVDLTGCALFFGYPRWLVKKVVLSELIFHVRRCYTPPIVWIEVLIELSINRGILQGLSSKFPTVGKTDPGIDQA
jgi:glucosyl-dolichyl phosphate glucuronosyltransferase